jgi:hypothetical protein
MSLHTRTEFKYHTKAELDQALRLHGLLADTPSQMSDAFRSGAEWAVKNRLEKQQPKVEKKCVVCRSENHLTKEHFLGNVMYRCHHPDCQVF